jgi:hypothetical protein
MQAADTVQYAGRSLNEARSAVKENNFLNFFALQKSENAWKRA